MKGAHVSNSEEKRSDPCPLCNFQMTRKNIPERTAGFARDDDPPPAPIPAHDAWVCDEFGHEIEL